MGLDEPVRCSGCGEWAIYGSRDDDMKLYCDDCYTQLRRRIRRGLEPNAPELL